MVFLELLSLTSVINRQFDTEKALLPPFTSQQQVNTLHTDLISTSPRLPDKAPSMYSSVLAS
jgi:hypothetical protein